MIIKPQIYAQEGLTKINKHLKGISKLTNITQKRRNILNSTGKKMSWKLKIFPWATSDFFWKIIEIYWIEQEGK